MIQCQLSDDGFSSSSSLSSVLCFYFTLAKEVYHRPDFTSETRAIDYSLRFITAFFEFHYVSFTNDILIDLFYIQKFVRGSIIQYRPILQQVNPIVLIIIIFNRMFFVV